MQQRGVSYEKHSHEIAFTSQALAQEENVSGWMVAKPVVVKGTHGFAMCVLPAPARLDLKRAAGALNESHVRLASESELQQLFPDCELGAEPPVGVMFQMTTIVDPQLRQEDYVVMQAGKHTESLTVRRSDWETVCNAHVAPLAI
ncbi:MAG: YbaK/EbsC family protein [Planctomycetes bacterium]|nr:YbaK/EbsC family protein [Planctomycetota bacterium]